MVINDWSPGNTLVGFEDMWEDSDEDFNDLAFSLTNAAGTEAVPEPGTLALFGIGLASLGVFPAPPHGLIRAAGLLPPPAGAAFHVGYCAFAPLYKPAKSARSPSRRGLRGLGAGRCFINLPSAVHKHGRMDTALGGTHRKGRGMDSGSMYLVFGMGFALAMGLAWLATPLAGRIARRFKVLDVPDHRKQHAKAVPRLGGWPSSPGSGHLPRCFPSCPEPPPT